MYMVRGNRGGAETDGRAEDPFEAAARGASASVPWKFFFFFCLTLSSPSVPSLPRPRPPPSLPASGSGAGYAPTATQSGGKDGGGGREGGPEGAREARLNPSLLAPLSATPPKSFCCRVRGGEKGARGEEGGRVGQKSFPHRDDLSGLATRVAFDSVSHADEQFQFLPLIIRPC